MSELKITDDGLNYNEYGQIVIDKMSTLSKVLAVKFPEIKLNQEELFLMMGLVKEKGLSLYSNDVYVLPYRNYTTNTVKNQIMVSIEGIRKCARSVGSYSLSFEYFNAEGKLFSVPVEKIYGIKAKITKGNETLEKDFLLEEFIGKTKDGKPNTMWREKPVAMLQKVAEAGILRMAFNLGGMHTEEEFSLETVYDDKAVPVDPKAFKIEPKNSKPEPLEDPKTDDIPWEGSTENTTDGKSKGKLDIF